MEVENCSYSQEDTLRIAAEIEFNKTGNTEGKNECACQQFRHDTADRLIGTYKGFETSLQNSIITLK